MEEALKVPSWQIAPPVQHTEYTEKDGDNIPLPLLGPAWIGLSADTVRMSTKPHLANSWEKLKAFVYGSFENFV